MAAPKYPAHEGLQLDDAYRSLQAPEPISYLHDNEAFASEEDKFVTSGPPAYPSTAATPVICGLKKRTFWIIFTAGVLIIVIGATVGGGVGGSVAAKKSKSTDFTRLVSSLIRITYRWSKESDSLCVATPMQGYPPLHRYQLRHQVLHPWL